MHKRVCLGPKEENNEKIPGNIPDDRSATHQRICLELLKDGERVAVEYAWDF